MEEITNPQGREEPVLPEVKTSAPQEPLPASKNWRKVAFSVLGILLALGSFSYLGYQYAQKQIARAPSTSVPTPLPSITSVKEYDPTANWRTYTNTKYGFSIKYPLDKGFEINEELQNSIFIAAPQSDYGLVISIDKNPEVLNLMDWLRKQDFASIQINGKPLKFSDLTITNKTVAEYSGLEVSGPIPSYILISSQDKKYIFKISGYTLEEKLFNQILSTFKFLDTQTTQTTPTPVVPTGWKPHYYKSQALTIYTPQDWDSSLEDFPKTTSTLIRFWKKSSPSIVPFQLEIKTNWDNTGNAQYLERNYQVGGFFPAVRVDPPKKSEINLERYQTNFYFETNSKVYIFTCVHNWQQDYLDTCNKMMETLKLD